MTNDSVLSQESDSDSSSLECGGSSWSSLRSSVSTAPSSLHSVTSSLRRVSIGASLSATTDDVVKQGHTGGRQESSVHQTCNALITRRACRYDCYCVCHSSSTSSSKAVAKLNELKRHCTDPTCEGAIYTRRKEEEPSLSFRKALSHVLSSKSIKIRYELGSFRMVSEGSEAMRYVKHGNLEKLKACIDTGEATLWDTAPDGWSLLHVCYPFSE